MALAALLLRDPASASAFATEELGKLGAVTDDAAELRDTLACYLDLGHDATRTARRLGMHRNTVTAKVTRAESRLGRSTGVRTRELQAALLIAEILAEPGDQGA